MTRTSLRVLILVVAPLALASAVAAQKVETVDGVRGGASNVSVKTEGNTDLRTTDAFKLEIFSPDGVLLGEVPLAHFADVIRVFGDRLFLIDRERGVTVYEYRIAEK